MGIRRSMEAGGLAHQPSPEGSSMGSIKGGAGWKDLPLLPFERDLIQQLGCTESEYQRFTEELRRKGNYRPAEYALIPDIQAGPVVPILVNLAIGVALTAVGALLSPSPPKPRQQKEREQVTQRKLGDLSGASRFNSTYGFDSAADLAAYGTPISLVSTAYQKSDRTSGDYETYTGGIVAAPRLVWSRMLSYGTHQAFKALYVVGETNIGTPDINGIWLGNSPVDTVSPYHFAIYWNASEISGRIKARHLLAGTRGERDSADPWDGDDVFVCPTGEQANDTGFSMSYTPSNQTDFGLYSAIANGTDYKVNWKVVSVPDNIDGEDSEDTLNEERYKIAGNREMRGLGAGYPRQMGIVEHNGYQASNRELRYANVGDEIIFEISSEKLSNYLKFDVTLDDVNDESEQDRIAADDALQIGEDYLIGKSIWRVIDRPTDRIFEIGKQSIPVRLRCISVFGTSEDARQFGMIPRRWFSSRSQNAGENFGPHNHAQANFYPLLKVSSALVRNLRSTEVTEIGIRSEVWARASGLCNFKTVPTPSKLKELDDDNVNLQSGTMNLYFSRYSFFTLLVRPAGDGEFGDEYGWEGIGEEFAVKGNAPVSQYNYIRIKSETKSQWEFKLVPLSSSYITRKPEDANAFLLAAQKSTILQRQYQTPHGNFTIIAAGHMINMHSVEDSPLFWSQGKKPTPGRTEWANVPSSLDLQSYTTNEPWRAHAWRYEILGDPAKYYDGFIRNVRAVWEKSDGSASVDVVISAVVFDKKEGNGQGQRYVYGPATVTAVPDSTSTSKTGWVDGDTVEVPITASPGNPYYFSEDSTLPRTYSAVYRVNVERREIYYPPDPGSEARLFEKDTQIAEVSHYNSLVSRSCDSGPEHSVAYVNESQSLPSQVAAPYYNYAMMGVVLRANRQFSSVDQPRCWIGEGIPVERLISIPGEGIVAGQQAPTNNFAELVYWMLTNKGAGIGDYLDEDLIDKEGLARTARFMQANRLFYDGVIEDQVNVRAFISHIAPLVLCNFVISNGQFSLAPALPTDDAGNIENVAAPISAMFTDGNIFKDSFELNYLEAEERQDFQASMRFRRAGFQQLPEESSIIVRWKGSGNNSPQEDFDMTSFCTRRGHAAMVARFLLSVRRRVDHGIKFKTSPDGLALGPGDYIKVYTQMNPYSPAGNGVVRSDLSISSATKLKDGTHDVFAYRSGEDELISTTIEIKDGRATDPTLASTLFSLRSESISEHVYQVEQLTMNSDASVEIVASYFPTDGDGYSLIAKDVMDQNAFDSLPQ